MEYYLTKAMAQRRAWLMGGSNIPWISKMHTGNGGIPLQSRKALIQLQLMQPNILYIL